jgi:hypothetical protein
MFSLVKQNQVTAVSNLQAKKQKGKLDEPYEAKLFTGAFLKKLLNRPIHHSIISKPFIFTVV